MAKSVTVFVCQSCGTRSPKWLGRCPGCQEWNSLAEESSRLISGKRRKSASSPAVAYRDIEKDSQWRVRSGIGEFDRVLGGGIVPGSLVLLGGEPGVGKSTLALQAAEALSRRQLRTLYVAGEESAQQIKMRGDRLGISGEELYFIGQTGLEAIFEETRSLRPNVLIVDSIQTVFSEKLDSVPGSISQVRECASALLRFAKEQRTPTFLVGHITKDGALAGPKALEHIVDTVLYFEGEGRHNHRIVRAVKNRFGPANELGVFEMTGLGLREVENPSKLFLTERAPHVPGSVVFAAMEGSRPVLVEVQALVSQTDYSSARREANGVDRNRLSLLLAMLERRVGMHLLGSDVFLNVAGGLDLNEPACDLAVAAAIISSFRNRPQEAKSVVFGELGLAGEVRAVSSAHVRVREAKAMGFSRVVLPASNLPLSEPVKGIGLQGVKSILDFLEWADA
ncbi:MAG TPA: DNA repair protein RadA [Acidobacteriota bacterium]|nr:DNA repair protein RadA [Acidobacteriota bacterium]